MVIAPSPRQRSGVASTGSAGDVKSCASALPFVLYIRCVFVSVRVCVCVCIARRILHMRISAAVRVVHSLSVRVCVCA
jgi:Kef-type K+ transport system membrane component KefB